MSKYPKLPKAFKRKWVAALRSGKFQQGSCALYTGGKPPEFCCLGVACRVAGISRIPRDTGYIPATYLSVPAMLTGEGVVAKKLSELNDGDGLLDGKTFIEIADWIERNL